MRWLKLWSEATCTLYWRAPRRRSQLRSTWSRALSVWRFSGSPIVRVNVCVAEYGPGVSGPLTLGNSARTRQLKTPVPVILMNEATGVRKPEKKWCVPSGESTDKSYEDAPWTGDHAQTGSMSPEVGFCELGTGAASFFWNIPVADHESPTRFSSSARTRQ